MEQQQQPEPTFWQLIKIRLQDLVLELISFKVIVFLLIYFSSREAAANFPYIQSIIDATTGGGMLFYKYHKDKNGIMGGEQ